MKVKDLDYKEYKINLSGYTVYANEARPRSTYHVNARNILKNLFPTAQILEEVPINLRYNQKVFLDFFIPQFNIVVEVHGEQHFKFTPMFHANTQAFLKQKMRDRDVIEWCEINNITYIELHYNEKTEEWIKKIESR